jgi:glycosyltransferase involved in cell wall biosynthesis
MKISVLLDNFNYARFLNRAVSSVVGQLAAGDDLILVDDGSTDDSVEIMRQWGARDQRIHVVAKENGGQLSAFNAGFAQCTGDLVAFLDADDEYGPGYLERLRQVYRAQPQADVVFCRWEVVGNHPPENCLDRGGLALSHDWDFGLTYCQVGLLHRYIGGPTSTLSFRRRFLAKLLPCPFEDDWRMRADDVLVYGSSVLLGRKYYVADKLVRYHVHPDNGWFGAKVDETAEMRHDLAVARMIHHFGGTVLTEQREWHNLILREFKTKPRLLPGDLKLYLHMVDKHVLWRRRFKYKSRLRRHARQIETVLG